MLLFRTTAMQGIIISLLLTGFQPLATMLFSVLDPYHN